MVFEHSESSAARAPPHEMGEEEEAAKPKHPDDTKLEGNADFTGPGAKRHCTDCLCLVLIIAMWFSMTCLGAVVMGVVEIDELPPGDPRKLTHGVDQNGKVCGVDNEDTTKVGGAAGRSHHVDPTPPLLRARAETARRSSSGCPSLHLTSPRLPAVAHPSVSFRSAPPLATHHPTLPTARFASQAYLYPFTTGAGACVAACPVADDFTNAYCPTKAQQDTFDAANLVTKQSMVVNHECMPIMK